MSTRDLPIQSLTAYRCRICKKYRNEDLLIKSKDNPTPLVLEEILRDFFKYIERCKIDRYTSRALMLSTPFSRVKINDSDVIRLHIQPSAGKALENFSVVNHRTNALRGYKGADHSAENRRRYAAWHSGMDHWRRYYAGVPADVLVHGTKI